MDAALYEDEALIVHLHTTEELHAYVEDYSYDDLAGFDYLIRHPNLAKGSALILFWLSDPVYHFSRAESPYQQLLVELQHRYISGFFTRDLVAVNPKEISVGEWEASCLNPPIAELMRLPLQGRD